jgi:hypothetical protein
MKETYFTGKIDPKALMACTHAFGCLVNKIANGIIVYSFFEGDDGVIIDTMTEHGAHLEWNKIPDELLEEEG